MTRLKSLSSKALLVFPAAIGARRVELCALHTRELLLVSPAAIGARRESELLHLLVGKMPEVLALHHVHLAPPRCLVGDHVPEVIRHPALLPAPAARAASAEANLSQVEELGAVK